MDEAYQVWVNAGDFFSNICDELFDENQKKNKLKPISSIQKSLSYRFSVITGFSVHHKLFLSAARTFSNKFKKNNGRNELKMVFSDWFRDYLPVMVDCETVENSKLFSNSVLTTVPFSSNNNNSTPTSSLTPSRPSPLFTPLASLTKSRLSSSSGQYLLDILIKYITADVYPTATNLTIKSRTMSHVVIYLCHHST